MVEAEVAVLSVENVAAQENEKEADLESVMIENERDPEVANGDEVAPVSAITRVKEGVPVVVNDVTGKSFPT